MTPGPAYAGLRLLTKKEKTWFFLLCGDQSKINKLIFQVFNGVISACPVL
jgi:hypothetical protein